MSLRSLFTPSCIPKRKKQKTEKHYNWFEKIFGFKERGYESVRKQFRLEENDTVLVSLANGRKFHIGSFETPTAEQLSDRVGDLLDSSEIANKSKDSNAAFDTVVDDDDTTTNDDSDISDNEELQFGLKFEHTIGDVKELHLDPKNAGSVFQVASQFNCLEMVNPNVTPEDGITSYEFDRTQGPICAMSCAPATIYRNYFVNEYGQGGKKGKQIDCLDEVGSTFQNDDEKYWTMRNGYALPSKSDSFKELTIKTYRNSQLTQTAMSKLKVGVHWDTEVVTTKDIDEQSPTQKGHRVTQVYSSAIPISYATMGKKKDFESFARLILNQTYQATFCVAAIKALKTNQRVNLYLTKIGGGVFGNRSWWIVDAIRNCLYKFQDFPLNVYLVHYGSLEQAYVQYLEGGEDINLISDYITSNINVAKLSNSFDSNPSTIVESANSADTIDNNKNVNVKQPENSNSNDNNSTS